MIDADSWHCSHICGCVLCDKEEKNCPKYGQNDVFLCIKFLPYTYMYVTVQFKGGVIF